MSCRKALRVASRLGAFVLLTMPFGAFAATEHPVALVYVADIPLDFIVFARTLLAIAFFHHHTLKIALTGLAAITLYKVFISGF